MILTALMGRRGVEEYMRRLTQGALNASLHREAAGIEVVRACDHDAAVAWMNYCPDCGTEMQWEVAKVPVCEKCGAPSHAAFNACWSCGLVFDEDNATRAKAKGYKLEHDCDSDDCDGKVANLMAYCPWCGHEQEWSFDDEAECDRCASTIDAEWTHCAFCGHAQIAEEKAAGDCPKCGARVRGLVVERNTLRRDVLECPECRARILVCTSPGCTDYALGGTRWDDTFCPDCTKAAVKRGVPLAVAAVRAMLKDSGGRSGSGQ